ncbi:anti-adapter protein iraM [Kosakonia sp. BK9b]|uniref:anti-adapter protein iraM n=1 Tax=Kosakonia sp. TaxID=1916651 RepID=UPI0028A25380|nr:anti-adapter protein iraM [Kosakonia sp.]
MRWNITDMLVSPSTGTAFAVARSAAEQEIILWYKGDYFLRPDDTLHITREGHVIDEKERKLTLIHALPYFPTLWRTIKKSTACPGNDNVSLRNCEKPECVFELCPYGIKMIS